MKKDKMYHIILDNISMWCFSLLAFAFGIWQDDIDLLIFNGILSIGFFLRSFRWLLFIYDNTMGKTITIKTKGYRFSAKERVYFFDFAKKICYSVIMFDDPHLKGKYVLLDDYGTFNNGELLEITYYKNSKVIKSISKE